jgi:hypothetical protein
MISVRKLMIILPIYIGFRIATDAVFDIAMFKTSGPVPPVAGDCLHDHRPRSVADHRLVCCQEIHRENTR